MKNYYKPWIGNSLLKL